MLCGLATGGIPLSAAVAASPRCARAGARGSGTAVAGDVADDVGVADGCAGARPTTSEPSSVSAHATNTTVPTPRASAPTAARRTNRRGRELNRRVTMLLSFGAAPDTY